MWASEPFFPWRCNNIANPPGSCPLPPAQQSPAPPDTGARVRTFKNGWTNVVSCVSHLRCDSATSEGHASQPTVSGKTIGYRLELASVGFGVAPTMPTRKEHSVGMWATAVWCRPAASIEIVPF